MLILTILLIYESSRQRIKKPQVQKNPNPLLLQLDRLSNSQHTMLQPYYANGHYRSKIYIRTQVQ